MQPIAQARHQSPPDIVRHAVWSYMRFTLSFRDVTDSESRAQLRSAREALHHCPLPLSGFAL
jgi:transposase-like protein